MKKRIARALLAALLAGMLSAGAAAAGDYAPCTVTDWQDVAFTFSAARLERREMVLDWFGETVVQADALVVTMAPGSTITYGAGHTLFTAYTRSGDNYQPLDGLRPEFGGTATADSLFGAYAAWPERSVDMLSFSLTTGSGGQDAYLLLGEGGAQGDGAGAVSIPAFTDVAPDAYYAGAVAWAIENKVTNGITATTFGPKEPCTVAQFLTFLWRALGRPAPAGDNPFTDVAEDVYYSQAAVWAYEKGLVSGTAFSGNTPCTRAMMVEYLWELAGSPAAEAAAFTDVAADAPYAQAVAWGVEQGIVKGTAVGTGSDTFSPDNTCTRGEIVTILYRRLAEG